MSIALRLFIVAVVLLGTACAGRRQELSQRQAESFERYQQFAGEPVKDFHFWNLDRWEVLGPLDLVVWTNTVDAYLLHLSRPCTGLEFAQAIGLSSTQNRVYTRFDSVTFEMQRCRISDIRPVDGKAYKAARREARAAEVAESKAP